MGDVVKFRWVPLFAAILVLAPTILGQEPLDDGPYLFHRAGGAVEALWVEDGERRSQTFPKGEPIDLPRFAKLLGKPSLPAKHEPEPAILGLPRKLLAISDVEGEFGAMVDFLRRNGVIDENHRWSFGDGHLVTIGDMVDRGDEVTEVLWLLYRLSREARAAGGRVHFVLGNHEAMIMGSDIRYIAQKYVVASAVLKVSYPDLYGADTELGRWLRSCNTVMIIGDYVFVHAGIAPTLEIERSSVESLNAFVRRHLGVHYAKLRESDPAAFAIAWGPRGPLWYRGYFPEYAAAYPENFGPRTTEKEIDTILERLKAKTIVIGHTKVPKPMYLYGGHQVFALDVPWTNVVGVRGLRIEDGKAELVDRHGKREALPAPR